MKVFVINADGAAARREFQERQLAQLGLPFERMAAVTPTTLSPPGSDPAWTRWERPMREVEKAIYASHATLWLRVAADGPALILEDDALLAPELPAMLERLAEWDGADHVSFEARGRKKLLGRVDEGPEGVRRLYQDRTGAAAYLLWPRGAEILLARPFAIADAVICAAYDMRSWQAVPALAIQMDQCAAYGLTPPIPLTSAPGSEAVPVQRYPLRRLAMQARMGLRQLTKLGTATREFAPIAPSIRELFEGADGAAR